MMFKSKKEIEKLKKIIKQQENDIDKLRDMKNYYENEIVKLKIELNYVKNNKNKSKEQIEYEIRKRQAIEELKYLQEIYFRRCVAGSVADLGSVIKILEGDNNG